MLRYIGYGLSLLCYLVLLFTRDKSLITFMLFLLAVASVCVLEGIILAFLQAMRERNRQKPVFIQQNQPVDKAKVLAKADRVLAEEGV